MVRKSPPDGTTPETELSERHEVRVRGRDHTVVFIADSEDGRLIIRQEPDNQRSKSACAITLSDTSELAAFFKGLRRIMASLGEIAEPAARIASRPRESAEEASLIASRPRQSAEEEREALMAKARQRNAQAFAPWSRDEEQEVRKRFEAGESVEAIARAHKRSARAIELRLQRLGKLPPNNTK